MRVVTNIIGQSQYFRQVSVWKSEARYIWPVTSASGCMFTFQESGDNTVDVEFVRLPHLPALPEDLVFHEVLLLTGSVIIHKRSWVCPIVSRFLRKLLKI